MASIILAHMYQMVNENMPFSFPKLKNNTFLRILLLFLFLQLYFVTSRKNNEAR